MSSLSINPSLAACVLPARDYDLAATLSSGQAFRWRESAGGWDGIIGRRAVRLRQVANGIEVSSPAPVSDWNWARDYLQTEVDLAAVLDSFPDDGPMRAARAACPGLRLLRQDPWECLASFILSSTKQIVQIRQMVELLCLRYGDPIPGLSPAATASTFPTPQRLAACEESELRACKLGFRAPYLWRAARRVAEGELDLAGLGRLDAEEARRRLMQLDGVGEKIANCVLLFACGFEGAFPVDVWIERALRRLYFPRRRPSARRLREFARSHFGPHAGYAQQYLFHAIRQESGRVAAPTGQSA